MNNVEEITNRAASKITKRLIPYVLVLYVVCYIDRVNVGYAALEMNADLGLTSVVFGIASGIFYLGYCVFEVPSNLLLQKFGARIWIARIMITWGIMSSLTSIVRTEYHLYIVRFLVGVMEAGFFPGVILYLTYWFRGKDLARAIALFMSAMPVAYIFASPVSGWILDNMNVFGLASWRWMFIIEGIPSVIFGIITIFFLTDTPEKAKWLTEEERAAISGALAKEKEEKLAEKGDSIKVIFKNPRTWVLIVIYTAFVTGFLGLGYWMPQIVKGLSELLTNTQVGLIMMLPYICAGICMILVGRHSDRTGERFIHAGAPLLIAAVALFGIGYVTGNPILSVVLLMVAQAGLYSYYGPYWAVPPYFMTGTAAAVGIATVNAIGNVGGFLGPYIIGYFTDMTGNTSMGLYIMCGCLLLSGTLLLVMRKRLIK